MKMSNELQMELTRRSSKRQTLLQAFKKHHELTTAEIMRSFGTGVSSRIHELRQEGHVIVAQYEKPGLYRYVYLGQKEDDGTNVSVVD
jgi:hypothetical protein